MVLTDNERMIKMNNKKKINWSVLLVKLFTALMWLVLITCIIGAFVAVFYFWTVILAFGICCVVGFSIIYFIIKLITG